MADALYGTGQGLDVEAAGLTNRHPAYMNTRFLPGGHNGLYPVPSLESLHLLLAHQVTSGEAVFVQPGALVAATASTSDGQGWPVIAG